MKHDIVVLTAGAIASSTGAVLVQAQTGGSTSLAIVVGVLGFVVATAINVFTSGRHWGRMDQRVLTIENGHRDDNGSTAVALERLRVELERLSRAIEEMRVEIGILKHESERNTRRA